MPGLGVRHSLAGPRSRFALPPPPFGLRRTRRRDEGGVLFTDVTAAAGLSHAVNVSGSPDDKQFLLEEMGCGAAFFDYDHDGWLDIFLVNGSSLDPKVRDSKPTSYLFHNNRDGTFTDVTERAGFTHSGWGQGCCVGDYDNDGFDDLFVSYWGHNVLYHNNGDGTFTDVSEKAGVAGSGDRWGAGCCFLDYDRDGHLDLFVANYVNFDPAKAPRPGESAYCNYNDIPVPCGPLGFAGGTNILYRNRGDGTFVDVSEASGIAHPRGPSSMVFVPSNWRPTGSYGMGAAAADFDNDGWPDIYVACDSAPSLLYRNNHDSTFREIAVPAGCALDEHGVALSGMGVGVADYDGDGWLDIVRTNFSEQVTTLYRNYGDAFEDASIRAGLGVNQQYLGFGVDFFDFDNDGWKDIFVANGHVYAQLADRKLHITYRQPKVLYRNLGDGRFRDVSASAGAAIRAANLGRGCAFGDFGNDGDLDVIVNNLDGPPTLLRNDGGNENHWISIKCVGTRSNRSAIGARVKVTSGERSQIAEVMSGSSYYSQNDLRLHFGLGRASKADLVEISWPSGEKETLKDLPGNRRLTIRETKGIIG
ncbi:MAG: CRTAC1 family protein [Luteitalea sp.]|nr:CRTAC1 family protein [Luteitalea sp.]